MTTMMYMDLEWKKCPFCGSADNLNIDSESLFNKVKEKHKESALSICCRCGAHMWVYPREMEENTYSNALNALNKKWNKRTNNKK